MGDIENGTILVVGATGKVGRRLTERLRAGGHQVRGVSRGTEIRFDWHDPSTWEAALEGVEAAYLIPPDEPVPAEALVARAVAAGVRRLVAQSGRRVHVLAEAAGVGPEAIGMYAAQEAVRSSGVEWTVLQANNFNQNFSEGDYHRAMLDGELALPLAQTTEPFIDVADIAEVAATVLTEGGHHGRVYELTGPESISYAEAVAIMAEAAGRSITFRVESPEEHDRAMRSAGLPRELVDFLNIMYQVMREGAIADVSGDAAKVLGREPVAFADWAAVTASTGVWDPKS